MDCDAGAWIDREVAECRLPGERLTKRLRKLLDQMAGAMGDRIPFACQDWVDTKAADRFFSNERVGDDQILAGHVASTRDRIAAASGPILIAHDTTEFAYQRERADQIGMTYRVNSGKDKDGRSREHTVCGLLMHSSLALTTDGLPLGLEAVKLWIRKQFKETAALKRRINRPACQSNRRKASAGWTTCASPPICSRTPGGVFILAIARVTSTSSSA